MVKRQSPPKGFADPGSITDVQGFRRLLHSRGAVGKGLNSHRYALAEPAVPLIVQALSSTPIYAAAFSANAFPRSYKDVKPRKALAPTRPALDLIWTAAVLSQYSVPLSKYVLLRDAFYMALDSAAFDMARGILDSIESEFGVSMWLMFSRLSLIQQAQGISAQKAFLDSVLESAEVNAFFGYLSFYFSYGLEENASLAELNRIVEDLELGGLDNDLVDYFRYHTSPTGLSAVRNPYDCITLEENSPIIDRFETFVEMAQLITVRADQPVEVPQLPGAIALLSEVPDLRIRNLSRILCGRETSCEDRDFIVACELYTVGRYEEANSLCAYALDQTSAAAWWFELCARLSEPLPATMASINARPGLSAKVVSCFERSATLTAEGDVAAELQKLAILARKQPAALCIAAFLDRGPDLTIAETYTEHQALWALSSPLENPKHFPILRSICADALSRVQTVAAELAPICAELHVAALAPSADATEAVSNIALPLARRQQYRGHILYNRRLYDEALKQYQLVSGISASSTGHRIAQNIYLCFKKLQLSDEAAAHIVTWIAQSPRALSLFPLDEAASWFVSERRINYFSLHRAVFLQACTEAGLSQYEGDLSDAYEDVLDYYDCKKPSDLIASGIAADAGLFEWYLRSVCTISRMEDSIYFDNFEEIEDERVLILQWLIDHADQGQSKVYTDEIGSIVKDQEVSRLARQFDRSRIFVDELGVRKELDHELRDGVARYKQLLSHPQLELKVEGIEQSLRKILRRSDPDMQELHIPSTEREGVFQSLYSIALNTFALSPTHGFQTYLSTRILHGSIEGELRSAFVSHGLMFSSVEEEALAGVRAEWRDRLSSLADTEFDKVARLLARFSEKVATWIVELKDEHMRVRTAEWPKGCFEFRASDADKQRLRAALTVDTEYEEFAARLFVHFWSLAENGLEVSRALLREFAQRVESQVSTVVAGLTSIANDGRLAELTDAFIRGQTAFAADVDKVISWFSRSGVLPAEPFSVDAAVGVASRISRKCYPKRPIEVTISGGELVVEGRLLNAFVDLLTNCFQNVAQHSGLPSNDNIVEVYAQPASKGGLYVTISNSVSDSIDLDELRRRIAEKLQPDLGGVAAMNEGGSGLRKMQRILKYDFQSEEPLEVIVEDNGILSVHAFLPNRGTRQ